MFIQVIGKGVVGLATGKILEKIGHSVTYYDVDTDISDTEKPVQADLHFICVPETVVPEAIENLQEAIDPLKQSKNPVIIRSTVPPETTESLNLKFPNMCIHHMPEFLRENNAELDEWSPELLIIGSPGDGCNHRHVETVKNIYSSIGKVYETNSTTSELLKLSINGFLSCIISYWNQVNLVAKELGVNSHEVSSLARKMERVPTYGTLHGEAFGGKCLPKDLNQFIELAEENDVNQDLLQSVKEINKEISNK